MVGRLNLSDSVKLQLEYLAFDGTARGARPHITLVSGERIYRQPDYRSKMRFT